MDDVSFKVEIDSQAMNDDQCELAPGIFARMRNTFFGSPEKGADEFENDSEEPVTVQDMNDSVSCGRMLTPQKAMGSLSSFDGNVLDQLDAYWQEQDALSPDANQQFGIMAAKINAQKDEGKYDMMMLSSGKKSKRSGAFCIGI